MTPDEAIDTVRRYHGFRHPAIEAAIVLTSEVERLREMIDQTADGVLLPDCEKLFCPKCGREVRVVIDIAYCDICGPDENGNSSRSFFLSQCYSTKEAAFANGAKVVEGWS